MISLRLEMLLEICLHCRFGNIPKAGGDAVMGDPAIKKPFNWLLLVSTLILLVNIITLIVIIAL